MGELFQAQAEGGTIHIIITQPRMHAATAGKFKELIGNHWSPGLTHATIDLSQVEFIDSSGVGALLSVYRRLPESAEAVTLKAMRPQVRAVIELLRLHRIFQIEGS
jgi:anti-sigma B factor antagonist